MTKNNTSALERHEMLLDAIREATEDAIVRGQVPAMVATQIRATTHRMWQLLCKEDDAVPHPDGSDELPDQRDLEDWERNVSVQAAVLAAMLGNDVTEE